MSVLEISGLEAAVDGKQILHGIDLRVASGEVHAVMGPNGSGKSTLAAVIAGHPAYEVLGGSVTIDGEELLGRPAAERSAAGVFLAMQHPTEVPGVRLHEMLGESLVAAGRSDDVTTAIEREADRIGFDRRFLDRPLNVDLSGGEKKRNETVQLGVLQPRFAILDEIDSGLDIDALRAVSSRVEEASSDEGLGVIAITHFRRLFAELHPDHVHVIVKGKIVSSGGPEVVDVLEAEGYAPFETA